MNERVYISGAMTGIPRETYMERFDLADAMLREHGFTPVNPTRTVVARWKWLNRMMGYKLVLLFDLWLLMNRSDRIYKIPGWKDSRGSNIESCVAFHFGRCTLPTIHRAHLDHEFEKLIKRQAKNERRETKND